MEPYVTSSFNSHKLISAITMLETIFTGVTALVVAKIINVWGRHWGLTLALVFLEIGKFGTEQHLTALFN